MVVQVVLVQVVVVDALVVIVLYWFFSSKFNLPYCRHAVLNKTGAAFMLRTLKYRTRRHFAETIAKENSTTGRTSACAFVEIVSSSQGQWLHSQVFGPRVYSWGPSVRRRVLLGVGGLLAAGCIDEGFRRCLEFWVPCLQKLDDGRSSDLASLFIRVLFSPVCQTCSVKDHANTPHSWGGGFPLMVSWHGQFARWSCSCQLRCHYLWVDKVSHRKDGPRGGEERDAQFSSSAQKSSTCKSATIMQEKNARNTW